MNNENKVEQAKQVYLARKDRREHPRGRFGTAGRWYPADEEMRDCCIGIRAPSRRWPRSYMNHCRTMAHVAQLLGVDIKELRKAVKQN